VPLTGQHFGKRVFGGFISALNNGLKVFRWVALLVAALEKIPQYVASRSAKFYFATAVVAITETG